MFFDNETGEARIRRPVPVKMPNPEIAIGFTVLIVLLMVFLLMYFSLTTCPGCTF